MHADWGIHHRHSLGDGGGYVSQSGRSCREGLKDSLGSAPEVRAEVAGDACASRAIFAQPAMSGRSRSSSSLVNGGLVRPR